MAAGWHVLSSPEAQDWRELRGSAVEEFATASGPAAHALCDKGSVLAVVEAIIHRCPAVPVGVHDYEQAAYPDVREARGESGTTA